MAASTTPSTVTRERLDKIISTAHAQFAFLLRQAREGKTSVHIGGTLSIPRASEASFTSVDAARMLGTSAALTQTAEDLLALIHSLKMELLTHAYQAEDGSALLL